MRPSKPQVPGSTPGGDANNINNLQEENTFRDTRPATQPATSIFLDSPGDLLERLRELASKATPGPWWQDQHLFTCTATMRLWSEDCGRYIAACDPMTLLGLLDGCAALRARVAELEAQHDQAGDLFASGRRYERAWHGLRVRALERVIERVRALVAEPLRHIAAYDLAADVRAELPPEAP